VIEWGSDGFSVRLSTTDMELAHALAVAGLHEIEELVADEISPLPEDPPRSYAGDAGHGSTTSPTAPYVSPSGFVRPGATHHAPPSTHSHSFAPGNGRPPARAHVVPAARLSATSRPLLLAFKTKSSGLQFQAFWVEADKKTRHPALGPDAHANGNGHVLSASVRNSSGSRPMRARRTSTIRTRPARICWSRSSRFRIS